MRLLLETSRKRKWTQFDKEGVVGFKPYDSFLIKWTENEDI